MVGLPRVSQLASRGWMMHDCSPPGGVGSGSTTRAPSLSRKFTTSQFGDGSPFELSGGFGVPPSSGAGWSAA